MIRLAKADGDFIDVEADMLTFEVDVVVLWHRGTEVGRQRHGRVHAVHLRPQVEQHGGGSAPDAAYRVDEIRKTYANAYKSWTHKDEELLAVRHQQGVSLTDIARELGRQPSGVRSRMFRMGLDAAKDGDGQATPALPPDTTADD